MDARGKVPIELEPGLLPWNLGNCHGELITLVVPIMLDLMRNPQKLPVGSDESFSAFATRGINCFRTLMEASIQASKPIVAVAHVRNMRLMVAWANKGFGSTIDMSVMLAPTDPSATGSVLVAGYTNTWSLCKLKDVKG